MTCEVIKLKKNLTYWQYPALPNVLDLFATPGTNSQIGAVTEQLGADDLQETPFDACITPRSCYSRVAGNLNFRMQELLAI